MGDAPVIVVPPAPSGGGGGSSSGGSSSSGSSSSSTPSAPPVDPVIAQKEASFQQIYMQLWGEPATKEYLQSAAKDGLNVWEFALNERSKPAYTMTKSFKDNFAQYEQLLKSMGID